MYLRITQSRPWFDLANFGVAVYHLEHYPDQDRLRQRKTNPWSVPKAFRNPNKSVWGLWDQDLAIEIPGESTRSESAALFDPPVKSVPKQSTAELLRELGTAAVLDHVRDAAKKAPSDPTRCCLREDEVLILNQKTGIALKRSSS